MNTNNFRRFLNIACLLTLVCATVVPLHASAQIPVTGGGDSGLPVTAPVFPPLSSFIDQIKNGSAQQITGLYSEDIFSFPVVQQPSDQPAYVSPIDNLVTQFSFASAYGSLGFLAHNNLAGIKFPEIMNGDLISVVYGDGQYTQYQVTQIRRLQAVQPNDPYSSFIDLSNGQMLTVQDVFYQTYGLKDQLILQTCISFQGIESWGRLFVIAVPFTPTIFQITRPFSTATSQRVVPSVVATRK